MTEDATTGSQPAAPPVLLTDVTVNCAQCGYQGPAEPLAPGKMWMEAVFWVAFLVPGVIYSLWRLFRRQYLCPQCKSPDGAVTVAPGRKVAMVLRAVLLLLFVASLLLLLLLWEVQGPGVG